MLLATNHNPFSLSKCAQCKFLPRIFLLLSFLLLFDLALLLLNAFDFGFDRIRPQFNISLDFKTRLMTELKNTFLLSTNTRLMIWVPTAHGLL